MSRLKFMDGGKFLAYIKPEYIVAVKDATPETHRHNPDEPSGQSILWIGNSDSFWGMVDGTPDEIEARIAACENQPVQTRGIDSKPMMYEEIAQLERSLLNEVAAHDVTKRRLASQELEIERLRSNLYSDRVKNKGYNCG